MVVFTTLVGFVVGTASIILVVSLGLSGRSYVMAQIEGVGSRLVWANYRGTVASGVSRTAEDEINESDVRAVSARSDLFSGVTGLVTVRGSVSVQSQVKTLTALGAMANYIEVRRNLRILRGRPAAHRRKTSPAPCCRTRSTRPRPRRG